MYYSSWKYITNNINLYLKKSLIEYFIGDEIFDFWVIYFKNCSYNYMNNKEYSQWVEYIYIKKSSVS